MNIFYENLPPNLKLLADHLIEPYDKDYNYRKDAVVFMEYQIVHKGPRLVHFEPDFSDMNQSAYNMLMFYSPLTEQVDMETVLKEIGE